MALGFGRSCSPNALWGARRAACRSQLRLFRWAYSTTMRSSKHIASNPKRQGSVRSSRLEGGPIPEGEARRFTAHTVGSQTKVRAGGVGAGQPTGGLEEERRAPHRPRRWAPSPPLCRGLAIERRATHPRSSASSGPGCAPLHRMQVVWPACSAITPDGTRRGVVPPDTRQDQTTRRPPHPPAWLRPESKRLALARTPPEPSRNPRAAKQRGQRGAEACTSGSVAGSGGP